MIIPEHLIEKYNVPVPRYTSYPPANFFDSNYTADHYRQALISSNLDQPANISLYIHIPFCPQLCLFCGCNTHITRDNSLKKNYINALCREIELLSPLLDTTRKVSQVHWGGGTPNSLDIGQISEVMACLHKHFSFIDHPEVAIECNPAYLSHDYINGLIGMGFNRISLGIQDFSEKVLKSVHREIPALPVGTLTEQIKSSGKAKVNFDFIYGLPHQTPDTFRNTIEKAVELSPDRLVTFSYAHIPSIKKSQKALEKLGLVSPADKLKMYANTVGQLQNAGYVAIGLDHFAKTGDELSIALDNRMLHRNFQGYCTRETTGQVYAIGATAISQLAGAYAQNTKNTVQYINLINSNRFATEKGITVSGEQKIIRAVITELMCNQYVSFERVARIFATSPERVRNIVHFNNENLQEFADENLLTFDENQVEVLPAGKYFIRNIAAVFDPLLNTEGKTYSKAL